jgi:ABC-2 type transport system permease protein
MSASADTPLAPVTPSVPEGPPGDEATSRPGLGVAIGVELAKLSAQLPLRIAMAGCVVVPIAVAVLMRAVDIRPADTLFGRWSGTTGFATSLLLLNWVAAWGVPLLSGLVAGDIFASEDRHGTWKALLTRSCTRTQLFLGKALAALLCVTGCFALLGAVSVLAGLVVVGHAPLVGLSGQLIPAGHAIGLVAASWLLCLLPTAAFVTMGLLFSIIGRNTMVGVLGPLLVALLFQLLETSASGNVVRAVLLSTSYDAWQALFTADVRSATILQAVLTSVVYTALCGGLAWWLLRRREFAGADAAPASLRHTTIRLGAVLAAAAAVVAVLSSIGSTPLTAARLEDSIATTFGNLTEVRYQWQTGKMADTSVPWHATCNRGAVTQGSGGSGAGDDWACTIVDQRASDGLGAATLDVTLKANGCYDVQSPPGAVGALRVTDDSGQLFTNPLYAFDGCLGTP